MKKIIRIDIVKKMVSMSSTTIWRLENEGLFPKRFKISHRAVGWYEEEILEWLEYRSSGNYLQRRWNEREPEQRGQKSGVSGREKGGRNSESGVGSHNKLTLKN